MSQFNDIAAGFTTPVHAHCVIPGLDSTPHGRGRGPGIRDAAETGRTQPPVMGKGVLKNQSVGHAMQGQAGGAQMGTAHAVAHEDDDSQQHIHK